MMFSFLVFTCISVSVLSGGLRPRKRTLTSVLLILLRFPEGPTVQSLPYHLHHGLDLWIHIQEALLPLALFALKHTLTAQFFPNKLKHTFLIASPLNNPRTLTSSGSGGFPTAHTSMESRVKSSSAES